MIKVLFFARLRQQLGMGELRLEDFSGTVRSLCAVLCERYPQWREHLDDDAIRVAVNQELADSDASVAAGDEVAFFPPVTGG
ncbi:molybdopterin converting factor subunit 1 [Microbulbifer yueqingensis]|uniref:Molybdopterin synthase sulfur carrier subunit n=1 Tax=Microbulbifer yueqingensis TaxID=658219 RepID=A0A1G8XJT4_9GAMM|nr:molybdopterin converting factor subunit 1 [Microbulbifer yueqingensis]SDJ90000.1 molybdopterin synthase subunit MoaD [Microbulbifer yueqingensis]